MGNAISPGFELVSPCPTPATITITPRAPRNHTDSEANVQRVSAPTTTILPTTVGTCYGLNCFDRMTNTPHLARAKILQKFGSP